MSRPRWLGLAHCSRQLALSAEPSVSTNDSFVSAVGEPVTAGATAMRNAAVGPKVVPLGGETAAPEPCATERPSARTALALVVAAAEGLGPKPPAATVVATDTLLLGLAMRCTKPTVASTLAAAIDGTCANVGSRKRAPWTACKQCKERTRANPSVRLTRSYAREELSLHAGSSPSICATVVARSYLCMWRQIVRVRCVRGGGM